MTTKKNVMILCSIVFIAYVLYKYYCSNINSQENEAFSDQLTRNFKKNKYDTSCFSK